MKASEELRKKPKTHFRNPLQISSRTMFQLVVVGILNKYVERFQVNLKLKKQNLKPRMNHCIWS